MDFRVCECKRNTFAPWEKKTTFPERFKIVHVHRQTQEVLLQTRSQTESRRLCESEITNANFDPEFILQIVWMVTAKPQKPVLSESSPSLRVQKVKRTFEGG